MLHLSPHARVCAHTCTHRHTHASSVLGSSGPQLSRAEQLPWGGQGLTEQGWFPGGWPQPSHTGEVVVQVCLMAALCRVQPGNGGSEWPRRAPPRAAADCRRVALGHPGVLSRAGRSRLSAAAAVAGRVARGRPALSSPILCVKATGDHQDVLFPETCFCDYPRASGGSRWVWKRGV